MLFLLQGIRSAQEAITRKYVMCSQQKILKAELAKTGGLWCFPPPFFPLRSCFLDTVNT